MGPRSMGKVPDLRRPAGRVAPRPTVSWSWPWAFPGLCFLPPWWAAGPYTCCTPGAAVAGVRRSARSWNQTPAILGCTARNRLGATGLSSSKSGG